MKPWIFFLLGFSFSVQALPQFTDVTEKLGIKFRHSCGDNKMDNIVESTGAGICVLDFNNDGIFDLYFVTGTWTKGVSSNQGRNLIGKLSNALYQGNKDGTFTDVTLQAGVDGKGIFSSGCSVADYDNDGDEDLYLLNYGPNVLYRNNGDGTFTDVSKTSGLDSSRWSLSGVWLDYDKDGWLDVYVANYLLYDDGKFRDFYPASGFPGPLSYNAEPDVLYRNNGNGTFSEVTQKVGMTPNEGRAMSATTLDLNNDGWMDLYVANDAMENYYWENSGKGKFQNKALEKGIAFSEHGQGVSSMGPAFGDVDRNGLLDIFIPDLRYNSLLMQEEKIFKDKTNALGLSQMLGQYSGWGSMLVDYDNDGWLDLFIIHGHAHFEFVEESSLIRNKGQGMFEDVSHHSGPYFLKEYVGRGGTYVDFDNDGDLDFIVVNLNDLPRFLQNEGGNQNHWLKMEAKLKFSKGSRTAIGTRVTVETPGLVQIDEVQPIRGYLSQGDPRLHFGLGKAKEAKVTLRWPDGHIQILEKVIPNQILKLEREFKGGKKG